MVKKYRFYANGNTYQLYCAWKPDLNTDCPICKGKTELLRFEYWNTEKGKPAEVWKVHMVDLTWEEVNKLKEQKYVKKLQENT